MHKSSSARMTGVASRSRPEKGLRAMSGQCEAVDASPAALVLRRRKRGLLDVAELFFQGRNVLFVPFHLILVLLQPVQNPLVILLVSGPDRFLLGQFRLGLGQRFLLARKLVLQYPAPAVVPRFLSGRIYFGETRGRRRCRGAARGLD